MDGGAWKAAVHGVAKSRTRLSDLTFTFHFHALEKEMATHSSVLAWRIPGTGEPGGLPSMGLHRVGHDWSDLAAAASSKVTLIRSHNHQQAGNTGEGEEELDNNLLSKADFIIIFTFLEKPGKYMLAYENSQVFQLTWT